MRAATPASPASRPRTCSAASISTTSSAGWASISAAGLFDRFFRRRAAPRAGRKSRGRRLSVPLERVLHRRRRNGPCRPARQPARPATAPAPRPARSRAPAQNAAAAGSSSAASARAASACSRSPPVPDCGGRGSFIDLPCPECGGRGRDVTRRGADRAHSGRRGRRHGAARAGHGLPADKPGLPPATCSSSFARADDPRFERHGRDLYRTETVDVVDAVLGTSIDVPTLDGQVSVKVPPGTQPDSMLRLRGKGLPRFGGGARGDLYVRVQVHIPERLSERQRHLFEEVRTAGGRKNSGKP